MIVFSKETTSRGFYKNDAMCAMQSKEFLVKIIRYIVESNKFAVEKKSFAVIDTRSQ